MQLKTGLALIGAIVAAGGVAGLYFGIGISWISLAIIVCVSLLGYLLAAIAATANAASGFAEFMRGWQIGMNTGLNGFLGFVIVNLLAGTTAAIIVGAVLGLLNLLTVIGPVSQSEVFQGILGWLTWLMPMSWLVIGIGLLFYLICFLGHAVTGGKVEYLKVQALSADWKTGTFFIKGGLISNLNPLDTAFNMGNFSFVDYLSGGWHKEHEAGHTLNLAAFGSLFHLIGALDENLLRRMGNAYSERLAESNDTGTGGNNIPMWY